MTLDIFQADGKLEVVRMELNKCEMYGKITGIKSLMNFGGMPSAPTAGDFTPHSENLVGCGVSKREII